MLTKKTKMSILKQDKMDVEIEYRVFVRTDDYGCPALEKLLGNLKHITKPNVTPAQHMNYDGELNYTNSGYISVFEYTASPTFREKKSTSITHLKALNKDYIHIYLIPNTINCIALNERNVRNLHNVTSPTLFSTDGCSPPSKIHPETGKILATASREICEYLVAGGFPKWTITHSEKLGSSLLSKSMDKCAPVKNVINYILARDSCIQNHTSKNMKIVEKKNNDPKKFLKMKVEKVTIKGKPPLNVESYYYDISTDEDDEKKSN